MKPVLARPGAVPSSRISTLELANISAGAAAFFVTMLFLKVGTSAPGTGVNARFLLLEDPALRVLVQFIMFYCIPALTVFVALRASRMDLFLQPRIKATAAIFVANILTGLVVIVFMMDASRTGSVDYTLMLAWVVFVAIAGVLLAVGFISLLGSIGAAAPKGKRARFESGDGLFLSLALLPVLFFAVVIAQKMWALQREYTRLCAGAEVKVVDRVTGVKSVALSSDHFWHVRNGENAVKRGVASALVNTTLLDYVETRRRDRPGDDDFTIEKIHPPGEAAPEQDQPSWRARRSPVEQTTALTAEYEVASHTLDLGELHQLRLGGAQIEIRRRADGHLIGYARYYWDDINFRACPQPAAQSDFVEDFIKKTLNLVKR